MKARTKSLWIGLCGILSASCLTAGVFASNSMVNVSAATSITSNLTMVAGASARKTEGEPGIKFTAKLSEYASNVTYGMLILPESAFDLDNFEGRYHAYFAENSITQYADIQCNPYRLDADDDGVYEDQWYISASLTDINDFNYDMSFIGVAYEKIDGVYAYAEVDEVENGRSIAYVAQMALKYEQNLTDSQRAALEDFADVGAWLEKDEYFTDEDAVLSGDQSGSTAAEYALKYNFNVGETVNLITKKSYAAGTEVSFEYYIPAGTVTSWWGMAWHSDASQANNYHAAGIENAQGHYALSQVTGSWTTVSFNLSSAGYIYLGAEVGASGGRWQVDGKNSYALLRNFTIGGEQISLSDLGETFADTYKAVASSECIKEGTIGFGASTGVKFERAAKYILNVDGVSFITKDAYAGGSTVSFKYYFPEGSVTNSWWGLAWHTDPSKADIYHAAGINGIGSNYKALGTPVVGAWTEVSFTLSSGGPYYLYFGSPVGGWTLNGGNGYVLFDDFQIGEVKENFNDGIENNKMFDVLIDDSVVSSENGEGYITEEEDPDAPVVELGEVAMKYIFNVSGETVSQVTKQAYAGGSTVSFKYYIPAGTVTAWWGLAYSTSNTGLDIYAAADANKAKTFQSKNTATGAWTDVSFTLPSGGPYYLYFGSPTSSAERPSFVLNGENSYMLIDQFTVNGEVETFNYGVENSIFKVVYPGAVVDSEVGEGWTPPHGDLAAKLDFTNWTNSTWTADNFISQEAIVQAGDIVTFRYMIPTTTTAGDWWGVCWEPSKNFWLPSGYTSGGLDKTADGEWKQKTITITGDVGVSYQIYFCVYQNWNGPIYVDNFNVIRNGETIIEEDFDNGFEESIFSVNSMYVRISEDGEGYIPPAPVPQGVKIEINAISEKGQSFVSAYNYAGGGTITFDYYMYNPKDNWWSICWSESNSANNNTTTIYAHTGSYAGCGGKELPKVQGSWETVTVNVPEGNWYFYIGGAKGSWGDGYVILDNVVIKDASGKVIATENFDGGYGIFLNNRPANISLVEGKPADQEPEVPETPDVPETPVLPESNDAYALVNLMAKGKITEYLNNGGYSSIFCNFGGDLSMENIPASMLYMEGYISYLMNGEKEFAIYFGNGAFIFANGSIVAFCDGNEMVKYFAATDVTKLSFTVTAGGKLNVKANNGAYVGMGMMDAETISCIKLIALGGAGSVIFTDVEIEAYRCVAVDVPVYHSEEGIDITAFAFDSDPMISDAGFQLMKDAGFTKTLGLLQGRPTVCGNQNLSSGTCETCGSMEAHLITLMNRVNADAIAALELAEKYGLKHYVMNVSMYTIIKNPGNANYLDEMAALTPGGAENPYGAVDMDGITKDLSDAFAGFYLGDEPSTSQLTDLAKSYKAFKAAFPNSDAYINLYPCDTSSSNVRDYEAYIDSYIKNIALDTKDSNGNVIPGTGYVCFDHYPLTKSILGSSPKITDQHLYNLELVAEKCRDNNLELRFYVKAAEKAAEATKRSTQSINDLYMQLYSGLAYGGKEICYYQFTNGGAAEGDGLIGKTDLTTGKVYNWAKQANNEIHAFEKAYMNFTWKSASVFGKTNITQFNNLKSKASAYGYIGEVSTASSVSVLIGNFDDADGKYTFGAKNAYMVVNYGNTGSSQASSDITITFNGTPKRAIVYQQGEMEVVTLNGNNLTLSLMLGEGAFVIPLTNAR